MDSIATDSSPMSCTPPIHQPFVRASLTSLLLFAAFVTSLDGRTAAGDTATVTTRSPEPTLSTRDRLKQRIVAFIVKETAKRHPEAQVSGNIELAKAIRPPCSSPSISKVGKAGMSRMSLMLRCETSRWTAYVSAGSAVTLPVMVAARSISRGATVQPRDVVLEMRPLDRLRQGYLLESDAVIGQETRRPLNAGQVLYQRALQPPNLVFKGERVRIEAAMGHSVIAALGEAKTNGVAGQQILVKNLQSGRTVRAWVLGRGRVSTRPPLS